MAVTARCRCWIKDGYGYMRFVQFYGIMWVAVVFNGYVFLSVRICTAVRYPRGRWR
jgi:hypothetical protein